VRVRSSGARIDPQRVPAGASRHACRCTAALALDGPAGASETESSASVRGLSAYSFEYGTPSAAGGTERPTSPTTAISVTT
jgi:hypothetical protein